MQRQIKDLPPEIKTYIQNHFYYADGKLFRDDYNRGLRECGSSYTDREGYYRVKIKGKDYVTHRIIWFLCMGYYPTVQIDHINVDHQDNHITNMRECTPAVQAINKHRKPNVNTGEIGVYIHHKDYPKKYCVHRGDKNYYFATIEEAVRKRDELDRQAYEEMNRMFCRKEM